MRGTDSNSSSRSSTAASSVKRQTSTVAVFISVMGFIFLLGSVPALADKLVLFKNGKVIRVKSVDTKDGWTRMKISKKNFMGVRTSTILAIEDVASGSKNTVGESLPNQATVGGQGGNRGGRTRGGNNPRLDRGRVPQNEPDQVEEREPEDTPPNLKRGFSYNQRNLRNLRNQRNQTAARGFNRFRNGQNPPGAIRGRTATRADQRLEEKAINIKNQAQNSGDDDDD